MCNKKIAVTYLVQYADYHTENIVFSSERKLRAWLKIEGYKPTEIPGRFTNVEYKTRVSVIDITVIPVVPKQYREYLYRMKVG